MVRVFTGEARDESLPARLGEAWRPAGGTEGAADYEVHYAHWPAERQPEHQTLTGPLKPGDAFVAFADAMSRLSEAARAAGTRSGAPGPA